MNVLHVEDNETYSDILKTVLKKYDIHIINTVTNQENAVKAVKKDIFDIILVDMCLNDDNKAGIEVIKAIVNYTDAFIIVLSGSCFDNKTICAAVDAGADAYELKLDTGVLAERLRRIKAGEYPASVISRRMRQNKLTQNLKCAVEYIYNLEEELYMTIQFICNNTKKDILIIDDVTQHIMCVAGHDTLQKYKEFITKNNYRIFTIMEKIPKKINIDMLITKICNDDYKIA